MGVKSADGHALEMDAVYDTICAGEWQWNGFDRLRARTRADGMNAAKTGRRFGAVTACLLLAGAFAGVLPAQAARVRSAQTTAPLLYPALFGVAATSANDAWAVGQYQSASGPLRTLIMHWNGTAWRQVPAPDQPGNGIFWGVTATSARNAWVVSGAAQKALDVNKTVIEQWNGTAWARVPSANPKPGGGILSGVAAVSASDAWAVGFDEDFAFGFEGVIEHWNGTSWTLVDSPLPAGALFGVTALSARDAWAVGSGSGALIEHWNGTRWSGTSVG